MMAKINDYFLIDILKVLLAIGVVLIHSLPVTDSVSINSFLYSICRIGVPLFFCFSGFFYKGASIFHFVKRVLLLYVFWIIVQFPLVLNQFTSLTLLQAIQKIVFVSTFPISWYLTSLIWCALLINVFHRFKPLTIFFIAAFLYVMCVTEFGWYYNVFQGTWIEEFNGIYKVIFYSIKYSFPQGFVFFVIGYYGKSWMRLNKTIVCLLLIVGLLCYAAESIFLYDKSALESTVSMFSLPLLIFSIFVFILKSCKATHYIKAGRLCRNVSTLIYLAHPVLLIMLSKYCGLMGLSRFIVTILLFIPLSYAYFSLKKYKYFKWLKYAC